MTPSRFFLPSLLVLGAALSWAGCTGSTPTITLTATDCEKDKIAIDASKTVGGSASNWVVVVTVEITCDGQPLPNAEIKFTPWIGDALRLTTDAQGKATYRRNVSTTDRPGNLTVTVEVEGADGTKTESITV